MTAGALEEAAVPARQPPAHPLAQGRQALLEHAVEGAQLVHRRLDGVVADEKLRQRKRVAPRRAVGARPGRPDVGVSGRAGIEIAQRDSFDAIILDLMLPDIDGLEVCKRIRALPG